METRKENSSKVINTVVVFFGFVRKVQKVNEKKSGKSIERVTDNFAVAVTHMAKILLIQRFYECTFFHRENMFVQYFKTVFIFLYRNILIYK